MKLTQKEVAFVLGLKSTAQISRWERGKRLPQTEYLLQLSALYRRLANDLLFDVYDEMRKKVYKRQQQLLKKK